MIQRPQSGIQRQNPNATNVDIDTVVEIEMIGFDTEAEAFLREAVLADVLV